MNDFLVKDSGQRQEYSTGMRRDLQDGKIRYDLVVPEDGVSMLTRWAEHMTKGAVKYGERNWELARTDEEYKRFRQSAFRHFMQWWLGEGEEDHAAAVFFNIQCAEYTKERMSKKQAVATTFTEPERREVERLEAYRSDPYDTVS